MFRSPIARGCLLLCPTELVAAVQTEATHLQQKVASPAVQWAAVLRATVLRARRVPWPRLGTSSSASCGRTTTSARALRHRRGSCASACRCRPAQTLHDSMHAHSEIFYVWRASSVLSCCDPFETPRVTCQVRPRNGQAPARQGPPPAAGRRLGGPRRQGGRQGGH